LIKKVEMGQLEFVIVGTKNSTHAIVKEHTWYHNALVSIEKMMWDSYCDHHSDCCGGAVRVSVAWSRRI